MKQDFLEVRNGITYGIKKAFDEAKIEIPFPHVSVYAGEATTPMPLLMEMRTRHMGAGPTTGQTPAAPTSNP
jgi:small-conductance mechanosensitive channel